jgi:hypothetical protein
MMFDIQEIHAAVKQFFNRKVPVWQVIIAAVAICVFQYCLLKNTHDKEVRAVVVNDPVVEKNGSKSENCEDDNDDGEEEEDEDLFDDGKPYEVNDKYGITSGPFKLLLCVNNELKMTKGKIAAQCGHATLGAYKLASKHCASALHNWEFNTHGALLE